MLVAKPCMQRVIWVAFIEIHRLKPAAIDIPHRRMLSLPAGRQAESKHAPAFCLGSWILDLVSTRLSSLVPCPYQTLFLKKPLLKQQNSHNPHRNRRIGQVEDGSEKDEFLSGLTGNQRGKCPWMTGKYSISTTLP